jgi:hypothetical protein
MGKGRISKKALIPGPERVQKIVDLFLDSERKAAWTGGKAVISNQQMQDVIDTLGADTPAWFQDRLAENYGHHGFLDFGEAKQILALIDQAAQKALAAAGAGGSLADQAGGKGVVAAPLGGGQDSPLDGPAVIDNVQVIRDWLEGQVKLHQRQLKYELMHHPTSRKDRERGDTVRAYSAAMIKLAGVLLDSLGTLTPDGWQLTQNAECPWCGEDEPTTIHVRLQNGELSADDARVKCGNCGKGYQAQLVDYLATTQSEGWDDGQA